MKKLLILLLCLLLVGCTLAEPVQKPTEPPPTESTEPTAPPPKDQTVKTDYSNYAPKDTLQPLYLPLEGPCTDLQPSEDYGAIYPYAGDMLRAEYGGSRYAYGLMDEDGRLLTEPVYSSVRLLETWDYYLGYARTVLPFWLLEKTEIVDDGDYLNYRQHIALASLDGSWVTDCRYSQVSLADGYILAVERGWDTDLFRFDIFDMTGKLVLTSESLEILSRLPKAPDYANYSDGMLRLECYGDDGSTWYTDLEGSILLGPYCFGDRFTDGLAMVCDDYDTYYYIDKEGTKQFGRDFSSAEPFQDGVALVNNGSRYQLIDTRGNVILDTMGYSSIYRDREYFVVSTDYVNTYYDRNGQPVYEDIPFNWSYLGHGLFSDWSEEIIQVETQQRFTVSRGEAAYHYANPLWDQGIDALAVHDYSGPQMKSYLLDENTELLMEFDGELYILQSLDQTLLAITKGGQWQIYGPDLQYRFSCPRDAQPQILCNDRLLLFSEQYSLCYNLEGELIFCYPLPGFGGD